MGVDLTYYIFEGVLVGTAGDQWINATALSGGGGGSTRNRPSSAANNPYMTGLRTSDAHGVHVHGGPIPTGRYRVLAPIQHPHLGRAARIEPEQRHRTNRSGFFIHGTGPHGSDGCIIPSTRESLYLILDALEAARGGKLVVMETSCDMGFA